MPACLIFFIANNYIGHFVYQCSTVPTSIIMYVYMHVHYVKLELRTGGCPHSDYYAAYLRLV